MANSDVIVSVRFPETDIRKLRLLTKVYGKSVGELIRTAVNKHIEELVETDEFKSKAVEMQIRYNETLSEILGARN